MAGVCDESFQHVLARRTHDLTEEVDGRQFLRNRASLRLMWGRGRGRGGFSSCCDGTLVTRHTRSTGFEVGFEANSGTVLGYISPAKHSDMQGEAENPTKYRH